MKINDVQGTIQRINPQDLRKSDNSQVKPANPETKSADGDSLELSPSARVPALSEVTSTAAANEVSALTPARLDEIKGRIASGYYSQPAVASDTAGRLLSFYGR